ncbi:MAG: preprotein translocase subunit SecE [Patescibacteria group bacterium]|nr:preprotein translocase subunit SecE [Patescibacteria group bacterium]
MSFAEYIQETRGEMRHVSWPNRRQVAIFTATVVAASIVVSLFLGLFDFMFGAGLRELVRLSPNRVPLELPADLGTGAAPGEGALPAGGEPAPDMGATPATPTPTPAPIGPDLEFEPL